MKWMQLIAILGLSIWAMQAMAGAGGAAPSTRPSTQPAKKFVDVDINRFAELARQPNTVILDVRTPEEYAAGHLAGSVLIDVRNADFAKKIAALDKSKTYLVHCRSGVRSVTACNALGELGIPNLYNMVGGITAWQAAGKPVEK